VRLAGIGWVTVVGIAGDVREPSSVLGNASKPEWQVYVPYTLNPSIEVMLVARRPGAVTAAAPMRGRDPGA
jgi:hypothetical protein